MSRTPSDFRNRKTKLWKIIVLEKSFALGKINSKVSGIRDQRINFQVNASRRNLVVPQEPSWKFFLGPELKFLQEPNWLIVKCGDRKKQRHLSTNPYKSYEP